MPPVRRSRRGERTADGVRACPDPRVQTSIALRYVQEQFGKAYRQTVGLDFFTRSLELGGGVTANIQIWDIGGQSIGSPMISNYLQGADVGALSTTFVHPPCDVCCPGEGGNSLPRYALGAT